MIILYDVDGLSMTEVAECLVITAPTFPLWLGRSGMAAAVRAARERPVRQGTRRRRARIYTKGASTLRDYRDSVL